MNRKHYQCTIADCSNKHFSKSYCRKHYEQVRAHGSIQTKTDVAARYAARPRGVHPAKGKKVRWSSEHIAAIKKANTGRHPWNKVGDGVTSLNKLERSKFRKAMQQLVFQRDNYTCQICDVSGVPIQVDHIKKWSDHPELRFEMDNCRTLCMACHYYITFKRKMPQGIIWGHNFSRRTT